MKQLLKFGFFMISVLLITASCTKKERSATTGWRYNDQKWGGFEKLDYEGQATGPNLVLVEGGTFAMGMVEQDVTYDWSNISRQVTVSSFLFGSGSTASSGTSESSSSRSLKSG